MVVGLGLGLGVGLKVDMNFDCDRNSILNNSIFRSICSNGHESMPLSGQEHINLLPQLFGDFRPFMTCLGDSMLSKHKEMIEITRGNKT